MKLAVKRLKDKLYYYLAEKNWGVRREYGPYVVIHQEEHAKTPWKHWCLLIKLNWHYRILRRTEVMLEELRGLSDKAYSSDTNLPYILGPESSLMKRTPAHHLVKKFLSYDIISFDIFDTLILRPFDKPIGLFEIIGHRLGYISGLNSFTSIRRLSEFEARQKLERKMGSREVTLHDIYHEVSFRTGIDADEGVKVELQTEIDYCYANPYMQRVFNILKAQRKRIILTSDMYLTKDHLEKLLEHCEYNGYEELFVSSEYKVSKSNGGLYQILKQRYPSNSIIHIGDNIQSDIQAAKKARIQAEYYKNVNEIGSRFRADWMSTLTGTAYRGIINAKLHNGIQQYSWLYEYGFIYGGLYIFGFCGWLQQKAKEKSVDKILFLARDGDIYKKIFDKYFGTVHTEYIYWSRQAAVQCTLHNNFEGFFNRVVAHKAHGATLVELSSVLDVYWPDVLERYLNEFGLNNKSLISEATLPQIKKLLMKYWEQLSVHSKARSRLMKKEIEAVIGDARHVAIVDLGWVGSGPLGLKSLIERDWKLDCSVWCWVAGYFVYSSADNDALFLKGDMDAYLFSEHHNRSNQQKHQTTNTEITNNSVFELFSQACHPSFKGFDNQGKFCFDVPEAENYNAYREIQAGIIDFCDEFHNRFKNDPYMYCISGFDAYRPFSMTTYSPEFFYRKEILDLAFAYGVGADSNKQQIATIGQRQAHASTGRYNMANWY